MAIVYPTVTSGLDCTNTAHFSGGALPTTGDVLQFRPGVTYTIATDFASAPSLAGFSIPPTTTVIIEAAQLSVDVDNSTPTRYTRIDGVLQGQLAGAFDVIYIGSGSDLTLAGTGCSHLYVGSSRVRVAGAFAVGQVFAVGADLTIEASTGSDRIDRLVASNRAAVNASRSVAAGLVQQSTLRLRGAATIADGSSGGNLDVVGNAPGDTRLAFEGTASAADIIRAVNCTVDFTGKLGNLTVASLIRGPGVVIDEDANGSTLTFTAEIPLGPKMTTK